MCENLSGVAHYLSCASELKGSITAWKTYTSLIQSYSEELKPKILLITTIQFLKKEINEGLLMLQSFGGNSEDKMVCILMFNKSNKKLMKIISAYLNFFLERKLFISHVIITRKQRSQYFDKN